MARHAICGAPQMGTAPVADALERAGLDPGRWVLVDVAAWLWLCDWADDPRSVSE